MALPKKQLKERLQNAGVADEAIDELVKWILDGNTSSIDAFKEQLEAANLKVSEAEAKLNDMTAIAKERDDLKDQVLKLKDSNEAAAKVQADFDAYKSGVEKEKSNAAKSRAVRAALKAAGCQREEMTDLLMLKVDLDNVEMDGSNIKDADALINPLKESYATMFATSETHGTPEVKPPTGGSSGMTREEIMKIKDSAARQKAIAENLQLFS